MMPIIRLAMMLSLLSSMPAEWTAVDGNKWRLASDSNHYALQVSTSPQNYRTNDSIWVPINTNWVNHEDSCFANDSGILRTVVSFDGSSTVRTDLFGWSCRITQKPVAIVLVSLRDGNWTAVTGAISRKTPLVDSNTLFWPEAWEGVDYRVTQQPGSVSHAVYFHPRLLDKALTLYDSLGSPPDLALGSVMEYSLEGVDEIAADFWTSDSRTLRKTGPHSLEISYQTLQFPGSDTLTDVPVKQLWKRINGTIYGIETVPMPTVKVIHQMQPDAVLWHNDNITITYGNIEDVTINSLYSDRNYGANVELVLYASSERRFLIRLKNLASLIGPGYRIDSGRVYIKSRNAYTAGSAYLYRVFKPWPEGNLDNVIAQEGQGVTWADWSATTYEWGSAGCNNASDAGSDNNTDGGGYDRRATEESSVASVSGTQWHSWPLSQALLQGWYDGTINEEGLLCRTLSATTAVTFYSTEFSTEANRPYFMIYYSVSSNAGPNARRRNLTVKLNGGR